MEHRLGLGMVMVLALAVSSCSKENSVDASTHVEGAIGLQCSGKDDPACGTSGVCALGYCRLGCLTDAECPQGALCIGDAPPYGCQLPQDAACSSAQPCKAPLVCGLDKTCRMPCKESKDCPRNEHVCIAGACVGESEKGEGAVSMLSCSEGERRCSPTGADCLGTECGTQTCNGVAPGWGAIAPCPTNNPFCTAGTCVGDTQAPSALVTVPDAEGSPYGIDATEVSRAQYASFVAAKGSDTSGQPSVCGWNKSYVPTSDWPPFDRPNHPVTFVGWCDAYAYCKWAGKRLCGRRGGGSFAYDGAVSLNSQWAYACSSGGKSKFPYGDSYGPNACNGGDLLSGGTVAVGSMSGCQSSNSAFAGIFDMSGNVLEWEDVCIEPDQPISVCTVRGGSYVANPNGPVALECSYIQLDIGGAGKPSRRDYVAPDIGFRCCSDP